LKELYIDAQIPQNQIKWILPNVKIKNE